MSDDPTPVVCGPDDGKRLSARGDLYRLLGLQEENGGGYGLWEAIVPPSVSPPPHLHRPEQEGSYAIDGTITVCVEDHVIEATKGAFAHLPSGGTHGFGDHSDQPA